MADDEQGEKTEEATQTRRDDFRKRGQVAHTRELATSFYLLASCALVFLMSRYFLKHISESFRYAVGPDMVLAVRSGDLMAPLAFFGKIGVFLVGPIFLLSLVISAGASILQVGFLSVEDAFAIDFEKINPLNGMKRLFSLRSFVEGFKAILKFCFIGIIVFTIMKSELLKIPFLLQFSVEQLFSYLGTVTAKLLGSIGLASIIIAGADYFFQKWDLEKRMRMSKQEVKEEHKSREGDPLIRARVRKIQRDLANRRMMEKIPQADVIITNPTHIAVALKYSENLPAPQLIAKGGDLIAEKIKQIAREHKIPIIENKPLARTIFKTMKLGQVIPRELFVAVAEVLSYVYQLRKKERF